MWQLRLIALTTFLVVESPAARAAQPLELKNGDFAQWQEGLPQSWMLGVGAKSGSEVLSRVQQVAGGGIELGGEAIKELAGWTLTHADVRMALFSSGEQEACLFKAR